MENKKKILHVVEAFGGGVYTFLVALANASCKKYDVTILYGIRPQTPEHLEEDFNPEVHLIRAKNFVRSVSPLKDTKALFEIRKYVKKSNLILSTCTPQSQDFRDVSV